MRVKAITLPQPLPSREGSSYQIKLSTFLT